MVGCCCDITCPLHPILKLPDNDQIINIMYQGLVKEMNRFVFGPGKDLLSDTTGNALFSA